MKIDIVITTYNRPSNVTALVHQLIDNVPGINEIIVVDSSDEHNLKLKSGQDVVYVHSSHKNQPYQRYLGLGKSSAEWVFFLDDDLEIIDYNFLNTFEQAIKRDPEVVGIGSIIDFPDALSKQKSKLIQLILWFTGEPIAKPGNLSLFGELGDYKNEEVFETEALSGGCMMLKRAIVMPLFSDILFSLFEKRWGMGEDKYLSFKASQQGKLQLLTTPVVSHPPIESTYFLNPTDFQARVLYSRLWLALLIGKSRGFSSLRIHVQFYYYAFWRLSVSFFKFLIGRQNSLARFKGNILALERSFRFGFDPKLLTPDINWHSEILNDLSGHLND